MERRTRLSDAIVVKFAGGPWDGREIECEEPLGDEIEVRDFEAGGWHKYEMVDGRYEWRPGPNKTKGD